MDFLHTRNIYQFIINILQEYNLKRDLDFFLILFNNASNNITSIDYFTHSLNPIMNEKYFIKNVLVVFFTLSLRHVLKHRVLVN
jgi:hypothetical protein